MFKKYSIGIMLIFLFFSSMFSLYVPNVSAQNSGEFPDSSYTLPDFAGAKLVYSVTGANLGALNDSGPRSTEFGVWARWFENAAITGNTVTVSGHVEHACTGISATLSVTLTIGSQTDDEAYSWTVPLDDNGYTDTDGTPWYQSFSVSLPVPSGVATGSFSISCVTQTSFDPRASIVYGDFTSEVDHLSVESPVDNIETGASPIEITANVFGKGNTGVPDGTQVAFTITDHQGGDPAGASIAATSDGTLNSRATARFTPPGASYWNDPLHSDYAGTNFFTITASAGGKQATYQINIQQPSGQITVTPTPVSGSGSLINTQVTLDASSPYRTYNIPLTAGQVISIDIIVSGDPIDLYIYDSSDNTVFSETDIVAVSSTQTGSVVPVSNDITLTASGSTKNYQFTAPKTDTFQLMITSLGQASVTLNVQASTAGSSNTLILFAVAVIVVIVVVVIVVVLLMKKRKKPSAQTQQYTQTQYPQYPPQPAPPPQPQANLCPTCGSPLRWIPQYQKWYCDREQKYL